MSIKQGLTLSAILATVLLGVPFLWLKIGAAGYAFYGPDVPDVYILGAIILGKDRSFFGINVAYKFQFAVIVYFIFSNLFMTLLLKMRILLIIIHSLNISLLVLFPIWLWLYTRGVIHNSDYANLTVHVHIGSVIYLILLFLSISLFLKMKKLTSLD